jgi:hypothetical protein
MQGLRGALVCRHKETHNLSHLWILSVPRRSHLHRKDPLLAELHPHGGCKTCLQISGLFRSQEGPASTMFFPAALQSNFIIFMIILFMVMLVPWSSFSPILNGWLVEEIRGECTKYLSWYNLSLLAYTHHSQCPSSQTADSLV